jgi:hypothetical protein
MNYKLIHNQDHLQNFINFLPDLKQNEGYFLILIARKKWYPESGIPSAHKLKRETVSDKNKIIQIIRQWEVTEGAYTSNGIPIDQRNLGVYMAFNPKNQYNACFELVNQCMSAIRSNKENINIKSMANDVIQGCNGSKNFIDVDVDIKEGEDYLEIVKYIKSIVNEKYLTFVKTNGGFHCLINLCKNHAEDFSVSFELSAKFGKKWYQELQKHPFKSELNIMSNDLIPVAGCNQGKFIPHLF